MKKIIDANGIAQKTIRIAYQIYEENFDVKELIIVGVAPAGFTFAKRIKNILASIAPFDIQLIETALNKKNPLDENSPLLHNYDFTNKTVLLVDDVANTGKTLFYALKPIMKFLPQKVQIAVLVDRQHKLFPISADFVGLRLSTTLSEHILVKLEMPDEEDAVYIN